MSPAGLPTASRMRLTGYLYRDHPPSAKHACVDQDCDRGSATSHGRDSKRRPPDPTLRTIEVVASPYALCIRLSQGIAGDLRIHERTVKLHRTAITTKLRVQSVAELTRLTDEAGLFNTSE